MPTQLIDLCVARESGIIVATLSKEEEKLSIKHTKHYNIEQLRYSAQVMLWLRLPQANGMTMSDFPKAWLSDQIQQRMSWADMRLKQLEDFVDSAQETLSQYRRLQALQAEIDPQNQQQVGHEAAAASAD